MKRAAGVLLHITSLPGGFGIGGFGNEAKRFIDRLADAGFTFWQVLPFSQPDDFFSPYKSYSAFAGNYYLVDLRPLADAGLLTKGELDAARQKTPYSCEFRRLEAERLDLLFRAAGRVTARGAVTEFLRTHPEIEAYCRYMTLRQQNGNAAWCDWQDLTPDPETLFAWGFIQYEFFRQWAEIRAYAHKRGVKIIGDVPMYVSYDSADVFAHPHLFDLDAKGHPKHVAGVPPDYFAKDGQLWGNPLYRWDEMAKDSYAWWRARIAALFDWFDGVRIDHFRALESYWEVPADAKTAREGKWKKGPGKPFIRALREAAGDRLLIAEDLGDVTDDVRDLIRYSGFPGMGVLQFAFFGDPKSPHLPYNYPENLVAYTGTHDNNTLLGYMWEQDEATRRRILAYCNYTGEKWDACYDHVLKTMLASHAGLVIFPLQDLLHYGSDCRMNTPGRAEGNWAWRTTEEQLAGIDWRRWHEWLELYGRI